MLRCYLACNKRKALVVDQHGNQRSGQTRHSTVLKECLCLAARHQLGQHAKSV